VKSRKKRESAAYAPVDVHVGKRIKIRRKACGLTLAALGELIGMSLQQTQKYESGANRIGASRLFELSDVLDVPISFFFDDMPPEPAGSSSTNSQGLDIFDMSEAAEVARMFSHITDHGVRLRFRELAKTLVRNNT
jgi:transcriptional regulator with XRE-family HTH domain